ncbi:MAG: hypothetical protein K0S98_1580 [Propionibacteriaceae bacterium]|nr:hypothetical protein [Propionibacteriaceae bacterium]
MPLTRNRYRLQLYAGAHPIRNSGGGSGGGLGHGSRSLSLALFHIVGGSREVWLGPALFLPCLVLHQQRTENRPDSARRLRE